MKVPSEPSWAFRCSGGLEPYFLTWKPLILRVTLPRLPNSCGWPCGPWVDLYPPPTLTWPVACSGTSSATCCSASGWAGGWLVMPGA